MENKIISIEKQRIADLESRLAQIHMAVTEAIWYMKVDDSDLYDLCQQITGIMTGYAPSTETIPDDSEVMRLRAAVMKQNDFINRIAIGIANALNATTEESPVIILELLVKMINERALGQ